MKKVYSVHKCARPACRQVRGAPAIAIVGALSLASELHEDKAPWTSKQELSSHVAERLAHLETSRPTAVNLANMANELRALAARLEKDNSVSLQDMKHRSERHSQSHNDLRPETRRNKMKKKTTQSLIPFFVSPFLRV